MKQIITAVLLLLALSGCAGWYGGGDAGHLAQAPMHKNG